MTEQPTVTQREAIEKVVHENGPVVIDWWGEELAWRPLGYASWTPLTRATLSPSIEEGEVERLFDVLWPLTEWNGDEEVCRIACRAALSAMRPQHKDEADV